jgi:hypothetical protein
MHTRDLRDAAQALAERRNAAALCVQHAHAQLAHRNRKRGRLARVVVTAAFAHAETAMFAASARPKVIRVINP